MNTTARTPAHFQSPSRFSPEDQRCVMLIGKHRWQMEVGDMFRRIFVLASVLLPWSAMAMAAGNDVTFYKDVLPILQKNCQTCHRPGQIAPMALITYKETRPWAKAIKAAVTMRKMPPWFADHRYGHFTNDRSLKPED